MCIIDVPTLINLVLAVAAVIATVAAVITAILAYKTIRASKQSLEAELLYDLLKEYSNGEMRKHLETLHKLKRSNDADVAKAYKEKYVVGNGLDLARRGVSQYYQRVSRLRGANYVTDLFVKTVCDPKTPELLREIVIPIEIANGEILDQKYNEEYLQNLLKIIEKNPSIPYHEI
jgi:hypothetical protein